MNPWISRFYCAAGILACLPLAGAARRFSAQSKLIKSITILQESGARPRFSPDGKFVVFDRKGKDGFYDVYISDLEGNVVRSITAGKRGANDRNNGNARFDPAGRYIVFVSEEERHFGKAVKSLGDPGVGLYSNLWATDLEGRRFWQLTNVEVKRRLLDRVPSVAVVNPLFSPDGRALLWTERYAEGGHKKWGRWRIMAGRFSAVAGRPELERTYVLITPKVGNYITAMGFLSPSDLLVAGNLDGQDEYGMDQYSYNFKTDQYVNLTNTPQDWDEDSCVAPNGRIVWMTNMHSRYKFNFNAADWNKQPVTREYYMMDRDGRNKVELTYFNNSTAPEYLGHRVLVAACGFSPDGRYMVGTMGVDQGQGDRRKDVELKVVLIEMATPFSGPRRVLQ